MAKSQKFKPAVMTHKGGGKHTTHDEKWIGDVVANVARGTPDARKNAPVAYHGVAAHVEDVAPGPRPSVAPVEPSDVPGTIADQLRTIDPANNVPIAHGHHSPKSGKVC